MSPMLPSEECLDTVPCAVPGYSAFRSAWILYPGIVQCLDTVPCAVQGAVPSAVPCAVPGAVPCAVPCAVQVIVLNAGQGTALGAVPRTVFVTVLSNVLFLLGAVLGTVRCTGLFLPGTVTVITITPMLPLDKARQHSLSMWALDPFHLVSAKPASTDGQEDALQPGAARLG